MLNSHLKRHKKIHERPQLMLESNDAGSTSRVSKRRRDANFEESSVPEKHCTSSLEEDMIRENHLHVQRIELGRQISTILDKGEVLEQSLSRERQQALDLYRKSIPRLDISTIQLWTWQSQAFNLVDQPTERQVIWITGTRGGEGKSVLQRYI